MTVGNISVIALALAIAWSDATWACNCPKAYMIDKYGTVAVAPPPAPPPPAATPTGVAPAGTSRQEGQSIVE